MAAPGKRSRWLAGALAVGGLAVLSWWGSSSVWLIPQNEQGLVLRFGRHVRTVRAGMQFTWPAPVERIVRVLTTEVRREPVGFKFRDQLQSIPPDPDEVQWLTGDTNILELQGVLQWMVKEPARYALAVASPPEGKDRLLRKVAEGVLTELLAQERVDDVLGSGKARLQEQVRQRTQERLDTLGFGVQIVGYNIIEGTPPPSVISAFNDVSSAKADSERMVTEAEGYATSILPRSRSEANAIRQDAEIYRSEVLARARGASESFRRLAEQVRLAPEVSYRRLWLDAVEEALEEAQLIVVPDSDPPFRLQLVE